MEGVGFLLEAVFGEADIAIVATGAVESDPGPDLA